MLHDFVTPETPHVAHSVWNLLYNVYYMGSELQNDSVTSPH